jgi:hypothetical protein
VSFDIRGRKHGSRNLSPKIFVDSQQNQGVTPVDIDGKWSCLAIPGPWANAVKVRRCGSGRQLLEVPIQQDIVPPTAGVAM